MCSSLGLERFAQNFAWRSHSCHSDLMSPFQRGFASPSKVSAKPHVVIALHLTSFPGPDDLACEFGLIY